MYLSLVRDTLDCAPIYPFRGSGETRSRSRRSPLGPALNSSASFASRAARVNLGTPNRRVLQLFLTLSQYYVDVIKKKKILTASSLCFLLLPRAIPPYRDFLFEFFDSFDELLTRQMATKPNTLTSNNANFNAKRGTRGRQ